MSAVIKTWQERVGAQQDFIPKTNSEGWYWREAMDEISDLRAALASADRKNLELTRVNAEQRLQEQRLEVALSRAKEATAPCVACDGHPAPENNPCAVCGKATAPIVAQPVVAVDDWKLFLEWAESHLGQGYSLESEEGVYIDKVTRWCFNGFKAGRRAAAPAAPTDGEA